MNYDFKSTLHINGDLSHLCKCHSGMHRYRQCWSEERLAHSSPIQNKERCNLITEIDGVKQVLSLGRMPPPPRPPRNKGKFASYFIPPPFSNKTAFRVAQVGEWKKSLGLRNRVVQTLSAQKVSRDSKSCFSVFLPAYNRHCSWLVGRFGCF